MKTIKCSQVGGENCAFEVTAETPENAKAQFGEHAKVVHVEMVAKATPENMEKWNNDFNKTWAEAPDN